MRYINIINSCHPSTTTMPLKVTPAPRISRFSINPCPTGAKKGKLMNALTLNHSVCFRMEPYRVESAKQRNELVMVEFQARITYY